MTKIRTGVRDNGKFFDFYAEDDEGNIVAPDFVDWLCLPVFMMVVLPIVGYLHIKEWLDRP